MTAKRWPVALTVALLLDAGASAASVEIDVTDAHGRPLPDAVVELVPVQTGATLPATRIPPEGLIDQRHETFLPLVTLVRKGGRVIFTNNDTTMHQVYSFSPIKQFAFEIDQGQRSQPVVFDRPGVAAIGCNIHDHMITYVYVAQSPWAALSDAAGRAAIDDPPPGAYRGQIWHPRLLPGSAQPTFALTISGRNARTAVTVPVLSADTMGKKPMHMQAY
jgi:plastocyanin